jgi:DNA-binding winged helix-turn-helix (wHTH) protein/tetratricopeptide (TPR) repeat protein
MSSSAANFPKTIYSFDEFAFDSFGRDLWRGKQRFQLPEQDARVLSVLLEFSNQVVSREQLARSLWAEGNYVDSDRSINNIISHLRRYLRDDARDPRYIQTVPKVGYRMDVVVLQRSGQPLVADENSKELIEADASPDADTDPTQEAESGSKRTFLHLFRTRWVWIVTAVILLLASLAGVLWMRIHTRPEETFVIGILPLSTTDAESNLMAESLRSELIEAVAQLPHVEERAANSLAGFSVTSTTDLKQIAQQLHLNYLVIGSLSVQADHYEARFELVRGRDAVHLSTFVYKGNRDALSSVPHRFQEDLYAALGASHSIQTLHGSTNNPQAYDLYLHASHDLSERSLESLARAQTGFLNATRLDPQFASAYAGLAETNLVLANYGGAQFRSNYFAEAEKNALAAIHANSSSATAHSVLGLIYLQSHWDAVLAEQEMRRAIEIDAGSATHHMRLAVLLADTNRTREATQEVALARQLDPLWPVVNGTDLYVAVASRDFKRAIVDGQALVKSRPGWARSYSQLGWAYWYAGQPQQAILNWRAAADLQHDKFLVDLETNGAVILQKQNSQAYARFKLVTMLKNPSESNRTDSDFVEAEWQAFAGDSQQTLHALEVMVSQHSPESLKIAINPAYDALASSPDFKNLLRKVKMNRVRSDDGFVG